MLFRTNLVRLVAAGTLAWSLHAESLSSDVVVYGGTAGGVMASLAAAGEGAKVTLLEPGRHVGGMVSGGLGRTDRDRQRHLIGGMTREFFQRLGRRSQGWAELDAIHLFTIQRRSFL